MCDLQSTLKWAEKIHYSDGHNWEFIIVKRTFFFSYLYSSNYSPILIFLDGNWCKGKQKEKISTHGQSYSNIGTEEIELYINIRCYQKASGYVLNPDLYS